MAITNIYGFQQFNDYLLERFTDFEPFGKLPFYNNRHVYSGNSESAWSGFLFRRIDGRVWLDYSYGSWTATSTGHSSTWNANRSNRNNARSPSFNFTPEQVYGELARDPSVMRYVMGIRFRNRGNSATAWPNVYLGIATSGGMASTYSNQLNIITKSDAPQIPERDFYIELEFDFELGIVKRWVDSVRLSDFSLNSYFTKATFHQRYIFVGDKEGYNPTTSADPYNTFAVNDIYFMADTSHLDDGLPSKRLGPVMVDALVPKAVQLPETWDNPTGKEPHAYLNETFTDIDMRNEQALVSDEAGVPAVVEFEEPEFKEGEIIYCELDTFAFRNYGDNVGLNTQTLQGTGEAEAKHHELEPERVRVGERSIFPAKMHRPLDSDGQWTEEKLGEIKLKLWTTKPE